MVDLSYCMEYPMFIRTVSRIGIKYFHRIFDEYSPPAETNNGKLKYMFETTLYYEIKF